MAKLVIVTHPNITQSVINKKWLSELEPHSDKIKIHALYETYPDLNFDVEAEQALLSKYDDIIFQFPLHWFGVPFALKKYIDEVLTFGWAFGPGGDKIKDKTIGFAVSTGGEKKTYESFITLDELLKPLNASFQYCGCKLQPPHVFYGAGYEPSPSDIAENAKAYAAALVD